MGMHNLIRFRIKISLEEPFPTNSPVKKHLSISGLEEKLKLNDHMRSV